MIYFFKDHQQLIALESEEQLSPKDIEKLTWLFHGAHPTEEKTISGTFIGPRKEMITPWSTNAAEITQNCGINSVTRIESFYPAKQDSPFDPMLQEKYQNPGQELFTIDHQPEDIKLIDDIATYNEEEGLALSKEEVKYLKDLSKKLQRKLTDSEVFGFSQVNSEHCRHKIFNGTFVLDGYEMGPSLFSLIRKTSKINHKNLRKTFKPKTIQLNPCY